MQSIWAASKKGKKWRAAYEATPARKKWFVEYNQRVRTKKLIRARNIRQRRKYKKEMGSAIAAYKIKKGCKYCGYRKFAAALAFHHRKGTRKNFGIAFAVGKCVTRTKIWSEIRKCDILCANCHSILHYKERNKHERQ